MSACVEAWAARLQLRVGWQRHEADRDNKENENIYKQMRRFLKGKATWQCARVVPLLTLCISKKSGVYWMTCNTEEHAPTQCISIWQSSEFTIIESNSSPCWGQISYIKLANGEKELSQHPPLHSAEQGQKPSLLLTSYSFHHLKWFSWCGEKHVVVSGLGLRP